MMSSESLRTLGTTPDVEKSSTDNESSAFEVSLELSDDPQQRSLLRKWLTVLVISSAALCVACASSVVRILPLNLSLVMLTCLGVILGSWPCKGVPRLPWGYDFIDQPFRFGIRSWTTTDWSSIRNLWEKYRLSCVVHALLCIFLASCFCTKHR